MLRKIRKQLDSREISVNELCREYLDRIAEKDSVINSFITVCEDEVKKAAHEAQKIIDSGNAGALTGIPVSVKDNICTKNIKTTCASKMLADFIPVENASAVEKLLAENALIIGKTNMDEFAMGSSSRESYFGSVKNPVNTEYIPGGSSGGAAASVAADFCPAALGTDTGGSVRQPAALCGVFGIKPTYGTVSRYGLIAFASSLDQIGVIAKSAEDCGIVLNAVSGTDSRDSTTVNSGIYDYTSNIGCSFRDKKIAVIEDFFGENISDEVKCSIEKVVEYYKKIGCRVISKRMPSLKYAVSAYYLLSSAEAASNLSRFDGIKYGYRTEEGINFNELIKKTRSEGFGDEVKRRIMLGNYALSGGYYNEYYKNALQIRKLLCAELEEILEECDFIAAPTVPEGAYKTEEKELDPVKIYLSDFCTVGASIAGIPAINMPCGTDKNGMPLGVSLMGRYFCEPLIIAAADRYWQEN